MVFQIASKLNKSWCNSAVLLPSAAVRTITPKFFGRMASTILWSLFLSSDEWIFLDTATISLKGVSTTNRPGNDSSQLNLGPFAAIGSFKICTNTLGLPFNTSLILPVFKISASD